MSQGSPNSMIPDMSPLEHLVDQDVTPRQVCGVLAKMFQVQQTEVAILRLERGLLHFIFPDELRTAGSIPISSSSIAAHTTSGACPVNGVCSLSSRAGTLALAGATRRARWSPRSTTGSRKASTHRIWSPRANFSCRSTRSSASRTDRKPKACRAFRGR